MPGGGFVATFTDITEIKRADRTLNDSEEFLGRIFRSSPVAYAVSKPKDGAHYDVNEAWMKITGYSYEEAMAHSAEELGIWADKKDRDRFVERLSQEGSVRDYEAKFRTKDGTEIDMIVAGEYLDLYAEPRLLIVAHDITGRKQAEADLQMRAADARSANDAKSSFISNMSHELRTPLTGMLGFIELINRETHGSIGNKQYSEYISLMWKSRHMLTLINDILDFSKIEAGKLELDEAAFHLSEVTDSTTDILAHRAHERGIELACFVAPEVPTELIGDSSRLFQIVLNLVSNAIKFTERGGVKVKVSVDATLGNQVVVRFEISDTGIGIAEDIQALLFEEFRQADASVTKKYGGTGLGLAISKQLVHFMNGEIGVESELGKGSTFWFTVTLSKQAEADDGSFAKLSPSLQGRRALVVDDNAVSRGVCQDYLEALGADVTTADDTPAALAELAEAAVGSPYELAIVDHDMASVGSDDLGRLFRSEAENDGLKMVLASTSDKVASHEAARELGFDVLLHKPVHLTGMLTCLAHLYEIDLPRGTRSEADATSVAMPDDRVVRILVAEDNKVNQRLLDAFLGAAGHEFDIVENGVKAVEAVRTRSYDLVLMDVNMPEMGGIEATVRILELPAENNNEIPIIAVTAGAMREDREKCFEAGMNDHIGKPIDQRLLFEKIAQWTGTEVTSVVPTLDVSAASAEEEISDEASAALQNILGAIDDSVGKPD